MRDESFVVRNVTYGMLDSIISTTGVLAGMAHAGVDARVILITGTILVGVEATSMAFGAALSDEHFEISETLHTSPSRKWTSSLVMLLAYALTGFALLVPYMLADPKAATEWVAGIAVASIFGLVAHFQGAGKGARSALVGLCIVGLSMLTGGQLKEL